MNHPEYIVYYRDQRTLLFYIYYSSGKYLETYDTEIINKQNNFVCSKLTKHKFTEMQEQGMTKEEILQTYSVKFLEWRNQLLNSEVLKTKYDFFEQFTMRDGSKSVCSNESNIYRFYALFNSKYKNDYYEKISFNEYLFYEDTYNGGLMRCVEGTFNCLGYDFKLAYPTLMSSNLNLFGNNYKFYFPTKQGTLKKYKKLPTLLKYGIYRVKIQSSNAKFHKIFQVSNKDTYTHYDIQFCIDHQELLSIEFEMNDTEEYNALIYENKDLIDGKEVFGFWFHRIIELKNEQPKNGLIKLLSSSVWGYLSRYNKRYVGEDEMSELEKTKTFTYCVNKDADYFILNERDTHTGVNYLILDRKNPYKFNYRLKPFITSLQRIVIAKIALHIGVEKIVRINTDNVTFDKDKLTEKSKLKLLKVSPTFIQEAKTTGRYIVNKVNFDTSSSVGEKLFFSSSTNEIDED